MWVIFYCRLIYICPWLVNNFKEICRRGSLIINKDNFLPYLLPQRNALTCFLKIEDSWSRIQSNIELIQMSWSILWSKITSNYKRNRIRIWKKNQISLIPLLWVQDRTNISWPHQSEKLKEELLHVQEKILLTNHIFHSNLDKFLDLDRYYWIYTVWRWNQK